MNKPLHALLVEDSEDDAALLVKELHRGRYAVTYERVETAAALKAALARGRWDIVFCDFTMPQFSGDIALKIVKESGVDAPFIYVSGTMGEDHAVEAMKAGAHDYITKSDLTRLAPAVGRVLRQAEARRQHPSAEESRSESEAKERRLSVSSATEQWADKSQLLHAWNVEVTGQLASVAHDFNNLLAVIRGNAEVMLMNPDWRGAAALECLQQIIAATERSATLTRQLHALHRRQVEQTQPLDLNKAAANLGKMLGQILGGGIRLQCVYDARPAFVRADIGMIEQVLVNLVVNARDAMPRGGQLLIKTDRTTFDERGARAHPQGRAGEFVRLSVADTGTGIAPELLPRIFERFVTTKTPDKGTGLGLATVHGIIHQHQGWIEVSSRLGAGTTFEVFLPAIASPNPVTALPRDDTAPRGGAETILLVEDEAAVRLPMRRLLEAAGYGVWEAACAGDALKMWRDGKMEAELLVTDVSLPDGPTGYELAEQLRSQKPSLKAVFVSGYGANVAGGDASFRPGSKSFFLQKPFPSRALIETVRRCLDAI